MNLDQAIARLDPHRDVDWTSDGLPRMDALVALTGDASLTRKRVTDAAPGLTRASAAARAIEAEQQPGEQLEDEDAEVLGDADGLPEDDDALGEDLDDGDAHHDAPAPAPPQIQPVHVLSRPLHEVLASRELVEEAIAALGERHQELVRERERLAQDFRQLSAKSDMLQRALVQHERRAPSTAQRDNVTAYLDRQKQIRAERAARVARFTEVGIRPEDLRDSLSGMSKLDRAMAQRKPPLGATRPAPRAAL